jgi:hypothetical protein
MAKETVETYRVLRDGTRVGYSIRNFGDFMPEAKGMENLRTLLNAGVVEKVYVTQDDIDDWREDQDERDEETAPQSEEAPSPRRKVKKKKSVKTPSGKKKIVKKKGKTSGLAERSV